MAPPKITVVGCGYVGMSLSVLLAERYAVTVLEVDPARVALVNARQSTVVDPDITAFLASKTLDLKATLSAESAYDSADIILIATPTNYDPDTNSFDTGSVDTVVAAIAARNTQAVIVIKSTVPVGHTEKLADQFKETVILFSPEFLREGQALRDNLYPSRIIVGGPSGPCQVFSEILRSVAVTPDVDVLVMSSSEAEAVKLFANTYLAMRVSFFNELDSYALSHDLDTESIIRGVCLDERIGSGYNNPSFGYGGYCLPKDTKQLKANYKDVPNALIGAIVHANSIRKDFIADSIISKNPQIVGIHRLIMKSGSDNFRASSIRGIIERIKVKGIKVVIYEPVLIEQGESEFFHSQVIESLEEFIRISDLIIANRMADELQDVKDKVYTRDLFNFD